VYDDFSGERRSREQDLYQLIAFCKSCGKLMFCPNAQSKTILCNHCGLHHEWLQHAPTAFVYLTRTDGKPVQAQCVDSSFGGA
jgi:acetyl-CoA carboxylase beta subunit